MPEVIEPQDTNSKIADRLNEEVKEAVDKFNEAEITSKATEIAIEQSGLQGMFKTKEQWAEQGVVPLPSETVKAAAKKTRNKTNKAPQTGKILTADEVLLKLEAQTQAVKWVQGIANPDIPKMSHVKVRELLISMQNQIDKIKSETLTAIQTV